MRLQVTALVVRSWDLDHLDLLWEINSIPAPRDRNAHEIFDYDFYILRTVDAPLADYKEIAGPLRNVYRLRDTEVSLLHKWRRYYYKLRVVHRPTGEEFVTEPQSHLPEKDLIAAEVTRQEDKLFREFIGRRCILYPALTFGPRCSCFDQTLGRVTRSGHLPCFGTGYLGGYHRPIIAFVQIDPVAVSSVESSLQEQQPRVTTGRLISFPPVNPNDILIEAENLRWKVISKTPTERLRGALKQELTLHQLPIGDVEYELPVKIDPGSFQPAAKRNFTNPHNLEADDDDYAQMLNFFGVPGGHVR